MGRDLATENRSIAAGSWLLGSTLYRDKQRREVELARGPHNMKTPPVVQAWLWTNLTRAAPPQQGRNRGTYSIATEAESVHASSEAGVKRQKKMFPN